MDGKNNQTYQSLAILGAVLIIILVSAVIPAKWLGLETKKSSYKKLDLSSLTSPSEIAEDTNDDGVVGWNEIVTTTFKDSTTTLASINKKPINQKSIDELNDPNNLTSSFSKNIYLATAYLKERGITDETTKQEAVNYLMQKEAEKIVITKYTFEDIKIAKSETKESIKVYGNTIAPLLNEIISSKIITDDIASLATFVKTKDEKSLLPLTKNEARVTSILQKLLTVEVPPSAASYHILAINRIVHYRDTLSNLSKVGSDPVRSTLTIDSYQDTAFLVLRLPNKFSDYFNAQNVAFYENEKGYMFTTGYLYK